MTNGFLRLTKVCECCSVTFKTNRDSQKYCSALCRSEIWNKKNCTQTEFNGIPPSTVGAINELRAATYFLAKGFEVFRALSPACSCDLAILKDDNLLRIEVRTGYTRADGKITTNRKHRADILVIISGDGVIHLEGVEDGDGL